MKTLLSTLIFSILGLNIIFAQEKLNLDDPKDQDQFIATAVRKLDVRKKDDRTWLNYLPFSQVPYSGRYVKFYDNGQLQVARFYKDGRYEGPSVVWYESGQKMYEVNFKDGKEDGLQTQWYKNGQKRFESKKSKDGIVTANSWKPNGEKCPITNIVDGTGVMIKYGEDGADDLRLTYTDGKLPWEKD